MSRKHNSKGRSTSEGRYTRLMHFMMETPAWASLSPYEKTLYVELAKIYNGTNNGYLGLGVRRAAELCNMSVNKVAACFKVLEARGFIETAEPSAFSRKDRTATEWRLTQWTCNRTNQPGSRAFMKWRPEAGVVQLNDNRSTLAKVAATRKAA